MHLLKKVARKGAKQTFDILINFGLIPSSPGAERFLRLLIQLLISANFALSRFLIMTNCKSDFYSFDLSKKSRLDKLCQKYEYDGSDQADD